MIVNINIFRSSFRFSSDLKINLNLKASLSFLSFDLNILSGSSNTSFNILAFVTTSNSWQQSTTLASNITINTQGNLAVASLQNSYQQKAKSFGFNVSGGTNLNSQGGNSVNFGINRSNSNIDRNWVDNQTSIIGTNSVNINTANNTDIIGSVIANSINGEIGKDAIDGGNLNINTKTLTFTNLYDHDYNQSSSLALSSAIGLGNNKTNSSSNTNSTGFNNSNNVIDGSNSNPIQQSNFYPNGSTTIGLQNQRYQKEQTTYATIGQGNITTGSDLILNFDNNPALATYGDLLSKVGGTTLADNDLSLANLNRNINQTQEITKDTITGALNINTTIDNRIIAAIAEGATYLIANDKDQVNLSAIDSLASEQKGLGRNLLTEAEFVASLPKEVSSEVHEAYLKVYDKLNVSEISDPKIRNEVREAIRQAAITGDVETLKTKVKELTNKTPRGSDLEAIVELSQNRDFAKLQDELGNGDYLRFLNKYTLATGVFFDGTGNNATSKDPDYNEPTNVARMSKIYDSKTTPTYIPGVGTSGENMLKDSFDQTTGNGIDDKQREAYTKLLNGTINSGIGKDYLFFPIDVTSFSRGATTGSDFINNINNENYWNLGLLTRSHLMFDPVGSYGFAGNNIDIGRDFSTPLNVIAIQINAGDEKRNLFDLQSLYTSTGVNPSPNNWTEITLPTVHAGVGGGYANGYQDKTLDMTLYAMGLMIDKAQEYGINFKSIPENQQPTPEFNQLMSYYNQAQSNLQNNPTQQNQTYFNAINGLIKDNYVQDSTWQPFSNEWQKIYNYNLGEQRGIFYPNDKYLNNSTKPQANN